MISEFNGDEVRFDDVKRRLKVVAPLKGCVMINVYSHESAQ